MKTSKMKATHKKATPRATSPHDPAGLASLRQQITNLVVSEAMAMVTTTIEQVNQGHFQAMKYLFEVVGLYPATAPEDAPQDSLARTLLSRLGLLGATGSEAETKNFASQPSEASTVE